MVQRELLTAHHHLEAIQICFCHVYLLAHKIICISWKVMEKGLRALPGETNANNRMTKQIQAWRPPILVHSFYDYKNGGVYFGLQCGLFDVQSVKSIWSTLLFSILITLIMSLFLSFIYMWVVKQNPVLKKIPWCVIVAYNTCCRYCGYSRFKSHKRMYFWFSIRMYL